MIQLVEVIIAGVIVLVVAILACIGKLIVRKEKKPCRRKYAPKATDIPRANE
jgi:hypothetical protein